MTRKNNPEIKINQAYKFLWTEEKTRFVVLKGGSGSGKSHAVCQYMLTRMISEPGFNSICARKIGRTLKFSVFAQIKQIISAMNLTEFFHINNTDKEVRYKPNKNQMFFVGMDDPEKIKSVTAEHGNIEAIFLEEASEFNQPDLDIFNTRLRGDTGITKQIVLAFNPISEEHWLKKAFWDEKQYTDVRISETTYKDNEFLDPGYRKQLESYQHTNPYFYAVYCRGEWGSVEAGDTIIPYQLAHEARYRTEVENEGRLQVGLDVARYGDDQTVAYIRRGMKVLGKRSIPGHVSRPGKTSKPIADMVLSLLAIHIQKGEQCTINVDATGVGSGAVDMLRLLTRKRKNITIVEVDFGGKAENNAAYGNTVTEMYYNMNTILPKAQLLPHDGDVIPELTKRKYRHDNKRPVMWIEKKADFKKRLTKSPDSADALVLAFYEGKGADHPYNHLKNFMKNRKGAA